MKRSILCGQVVLPQEVVRGEIWIEDGQIIAVKRYEQFKHNVQQHLVTYKDGTERIDVGNDYITIHWFIG